MCNTRMEVSVKQISSDVLLSLILSYATIRDRALRLNESIRHKMVATRSEPLDGRTVPRRGQCRRRLETGGQTRSSLQDRFSLAQQAGG